MCTSTDLAMYGTIGYIFKCCGTVTVIVIIKGKAVCANITRLARRNGKLKAA